MAVETVCRDSEVAESRWTSGSREEGVRKVRDFSFVPLRRSPCALEGWPVLRQKLAVFVKIACLAAHILIIMPLVTKAIGKGVSWSAGLLSSAGKRKWDVGPSCLHRCECERTVGLGRYFWLPLEASLAGGRAVLGGSGAGLGSVRRLSLFRSLINYWRFVSCQQPFSRA